MGITQDWRCWCSSLVMGGVLIASLQERVFAQITPDATLPNNSVVTPDGNTFNITGGTQAGSNLFHSFGEFSVPNGGTASFNNAVDIQNIISRVTGGSVSQINGIIRANGTANLFLINPNGIIFGQNASLNIGGSFLASTASAVKFANSFEFSATSTQTTPLLTVSVPVGLQYGGNTGSILNQSLVTNTNDYGYDETVGLQVQPGKTLALVGGDVRLNRGRLTAPGGRVELGGVSGAGTVGFQGNGSNLSLSFPEGVARADVFITNQGASQRYTNLFNGAGVDVTGKGSGSIAINARNIDITGPYTGLLAGIASNSTLANAQAGDITLNGTEMITIKSGRIFNTQQGPTIFNNQYNATASPGNILIQTNGSLFIADSFIDNRVFKGTGKPGNISLQAKGSISLVDASSILIGNVFGDRDIGSVSVQGNDSVSLVDSSISTTTFGKGNSGDITVQTNALRLLGNARLSTTTRGGGDGGNIIVDVNTLEMTGGGQILTSALKNGDSGSISVNAKDSITLSGSNSRRLFYLVLDPNTGLLIPSEPITDEDELLTFGIVSYNSALFANTTKHSSGQGGNITIKTGRLNVLDGAEIRVSSAGSGNAGNLEVNARSIHLDNGRLNADTTSIKADPNKEQATIRLGGLRDLILRRGSSITTKATGSNVIGGNINIDARNGFIVAVPSENSDISADSANSRGGNVRINASGIFGIQFRDVGSDRTSDITATGASSELSGNVEINTPDVDPNSGLVNLPVVPVDTQVAQTCQAGGTLAKSSFTITGRGGLPPNPGDALNADAVHVDLVALKPSTREGKIPPVTIKPTATPKPIVEATGWVMNAKGELELTANAPTTPHASWQNPVSCRAAS